MPNRKIRHGYNPSMMNGKPYDDGHSLMACPPGSCRCPGQSNACLPGCCQPDEEWDDRERMYGQGGISGKPYDDGHSLMAGCPPGSCWCPGGSACLPGCCGVVIPIQPNEGGGTCLGGNCGPGSGYGDSPTMRRWRRRRARPSGPRPGWPPR